MKVVGIDGAAVSVEIEINGNHWILPKINYDYKYLMYDENGIALASKDLIEWVMAIGVVIDGKRMNPVKDKGKILM